MHFLKKGQKNRGWVYPGQCLKENAFLLMSSLRFTLITQKAKKGEDIGKEGHLFQICVTLLVCSLFDETLIGTYRNMGLSRACHDAENML